jgi:hypothetical protein
MSSFTPRILLITVLASLALVPGAHAQAIDPSPGAGQSCNDNGLIIEDGYRGTFHTRYSHGSVTCTDGTICESIAYQQSDGTTTWWYSCYDSPAIKHVVPIKPVARGKATQARSSR